MLDIAIVGAGELGGLLAHVLARIDVAFAVRLIDDAERIAAGKALDISQSAPIERFATDVSGTSDWAAAAGAAIVAIADRAAGGGEWQGEDGLMLLRRLTLSSRAVIVCTGSTQRDLVERGVRELHVSRERLIGTAPQALAAAVRSLVALEANVSPRDVALTVAGVPPAGIVIPWEDATIQGFAATRLLDGPAQRRVADRVRLLWPPGPYALANAAASVIEAIAGRSRAGASCFVAPDDSMGRTARAAALPVRLGPSGVASVVMPTLSPHDRVALDNAMLL